MYYFLNRETLEIMNLRHLNASHVLIRLTRY